MGNFTCSFVILVFLLICDSYGLTRRDSNEDRCKQAMDIAILADISRSMEPQDRLELRDTVNELVDKLGVSAAGNHFGLVTFGDRATVHNNFSNTDYYNATNLKSSVADALKNSSEREGTRTDMAKNLALIELFTSQGGDRPSARNVMLIFTDGKPYISEWDKEPEIPLPKLTEALEAKHVSITVIGIGPGAKKNEDKMKETAGQKGKVFLHSNWEELSKNFYKQFTESVCDPVDGNYTDWFPASKCSVTCGVGIQTLTRNCSNPPPSNGGKNCSRWGAAVKKVSCNKRKCPNPIDGNYTDWSPASKCSVTCGVGIQTLTRNCSNPPPSNGGKNCSRWGAAVKKVSCNERKCPNPIDGNYTDWSPASKCSVTCGVGIQILTRTCSNPPPSNGGKSCSRWGPAVKKVSCNERKCPILRIPTCPTDVTFIVDSSGSIKEFQNTKDVVKELVMTLDLASGRNRAAMVAFSSTAHLEAQFGQYDTVQKFQDAVQQLPKMGGRTRIDKALNRAVNQVLPDARQDVYKIAIILTDGVQSSGARGMKQTSKPLRNAGVRVLAVGVGAGKNERRLRLMTDRDQDVVNAKNIQAYLQRILDDLNQHGCTLPEVDIPAESTCSDEPDHARDCQEKASEDFCWSHPDFAAIYCPMSCKLCS